MRKIIVSNLDDFVTLAKEGKGEHQKVLVFAEITRIEKGMTNDSIDIIVEYSFTSPDALITKAKLFGFRNEAFKACSRVMVDYTADKFTLAGEQHLGGSQVVFPKALSKMVEEAILGPVNDPDFKVVISV